MACLYGYELRYLTYSYLPSHLAGIYQITLILNL